ncbi:MAG: aspartyl protease family protein [Candidatus Binataceae bacterium]
MFDLVRFGYLGTVLAFTSMQPVLACDADARQLHDASSVLSQRSARPGGSRSTAVVPISVENGQIIVDVTIDGRGPFPMMFDTGGVEAVTPEAAAALGLKVDGGGAAVGSGEGAIAVAFTRVKEMRLGDAKLFDQTLLVSPLPRFLTDRGARPPLAGFVGYELLMRFVVRLDYEGGTMTLKPTQKFRYRRAGMCVPLGFADKIPVIPAAADGIAGTFEIDTGSSSALVLQREFVEQHGFEDRHPSVLRMKSSGVDGVFETIITRLDSFGIAKSEIKRPAAELPSNGKSGLPVTGVDGSIGYQILRQFVITFDYSRRELWFEHSPAFGTKTVQWKSGFQAIKANGSGFRVITVLPNTPAAAAGVSVDDLITEVDGVPAESIGQAEFGDLMRRPDGTVVQFSVVRDGSPRPIALTLKELLP